MNRYVATTVKQMNYAPPYTVGKGSIMATIKEFAHSKACAQCVPQSYSLDLTQSDYQLFGSLKKKSLQGYYYTHDEALQDMPTKVENALKNNYAFNNAVK